MSSEMMESAERLQEMRDVLAQTMLSVDGSTVRDGMRRDVAALDFAIALLARTEAGAKKLPTMPETSLRLNGMPVWNEAMVRSFGNSILFPRRDAAPVADRTEAGADGEKGVNNPEWPLLDRVEFALRDAGFDYDEAFRIAHLAARPQDASGDAEALTAHGIRALDRCCGELRNFIELAGDYDLDEMAVQALQTAIESMEMRKANAMQAKEAK